MWRTVTGLFKSGNARIAGLTPIDISSAAFPDATAFMCRSLVQQIKYDLILLDESEKDLASFIRSEKINAETPVVVYSGGKHEDVVNAIREALTDGKFLVKYPH
jgi:hypothetical protein